MSKTGVVFVSLGVIALLIVGAFATGGLQLAYYKLFAPAKVQIQREVFEESKSFIHASTDELAGLAYEYSKATDDEKTMIETTVRSKFGDFPAEKIRDYGLRQFLVKVRGY